MTLSKGDFLGKLNRTWRAEGEGVAKHYISELVQPPTLIENEQQRQFVVEELTSAFKLGESYYQLAFLKVDK